MKCCLSHDGVTHKKRKVSKDSPELSSFFVQLSKPEAYITHNAMQQMTVQSQILVCYASSC